MNLSGVRDTNKKVMMKIKAKKTNEKLILILSVVNIPCQKEQANFKGFPVIPRAISKFTDQA